MNRSAIIRRRCASSTAESSDRCDDLSSQVELTVLQVEVDTVLVAARRSSKLLWCLRRIRYVESSCVKSPCE